MNGIEASIHTLLAGGVDTCFANPGTSEMLFVAAADKAPEFNCVLCLSEGVVTGAADGYGRMAGNPAATLLHLGVGAANGLANLHNAHKARTPVINLIGQNGIRHLRHDFPLDAEIEGIVSPFSDWVRLAYDSRDLARDTAEAIAAARQAPGQVCSLIIAADASWGPSEGVAQLAPPRHAPVPAEATVQQTLDLLRKAKRALILIDGAALRAPGLEAAARIANATGATVCTPWVVARSERGAGLPEFARLPLDVRQAQAFLEGVDLIVLVGARAPVASFSYPDRPCSPVTDDMVVHTFAEPREDLCAGLERLASALEAPALHSEPVGLLPPLPRGEAALTAAAISAAVAHLLPSQAIIAEEANTSGERLREFTAAAPRHDLLQITGGAIGIALPLAVGAAVACPQRPVLCLESDGSGLYNLQALWTMARQRLNIVVVIYANRKYKVLQAELARMGVADLGGNAREMLDIDRPDIDWVALARGFGVPGVRVDTQGGFSTALKDAFALPGPHLIEARI
ncbi:acetolactate synthase large subunit [Pseudomonas bharatica]|uniref:acetolactate synthase large subunit n=1 Tax=Pseudomonas bharatica TaxID=2692112 RepID=UPI003B28C018